jgi:hypothetical protein
MTPLTPEQIEAMAKRIEARAMEHWLMINNIDEPWKCRKALANASMLEDLATEIRDGTFFEPATPPKG